MNSLPLGRLAPLAPLVFLLSLSSAAEAQKKKPPEVVMECDSELPKTSDNKELAKRYFEKGMACSQENRWSDAHPNFVKSNELSRLPVVEYNISYTLRSMGKFVDAKHRIEDLREWIKRDGVKVKPELETDINTLYTELKDKVVRIRIEIDPADGELQIDGNVTKLPADNTVEMDAGKHVFLLKKEGYETSSVTKTLTGKDKELKVSAKLIPPPPPPPPPPSRPFYTKAWFITATSIVVAAGTAAVVYVVTRPEDKTQPPQPPTTTTGLVFPAGIRF